MQGAVLHLLDVLSLTALLSCSLDLTVYVGILGVFFPPLFSRVSIVLLFKPHERIFNKTSSAQRPVPGVGGRGGRSQAEACLRVGSEVSLSS